MMQRFVDQQLRIVRRSVENLAAGALRLSGCYGRIERLCAKLRGGYILAFHNLSEERFVEQIEALWPDRAIPIDELVNRILKGLPTSGLFAITLDDGVAETVNQTARAAVARSWPVCYFLPTENIDHPERGMNFQWLRLMERCLPIGKASQLHRSMDCSTPHARNRCLRRLRRAAYSQPNETFVESLSKWINFIVEARGIPRIELQPPDTVSWDQVADLSRQPLIQFESHGVTHRRLASMNESGIRNELRASRQAIELRTGRPCRHFCYPYGDAGSIGQVSPRIVAEEFKSGLTLNRGRLGGANVYLLPRIALYDQDDAARARLKVLTI